MSYSIHQQLRGSSVLLTGATGYVGSLVLEALLRTTDVAQVYILLRPSSSMTPEARCQQLLAKNLFHKVRDCPQIVAKVRPVAGDLQAPQLGLSAADKAQLSSSIHIIIHCAADIRMELDIQTSLRSNYCGTEAVLQLARQCRQLRAMVHVSSAYVNMNQPRHSVVDEVMYPLQYGHQPADAAALVQVRGRLAGHILL
jgi:fatty acyl-CoA reductase